MHLEIKDVKFAYPDKIDEPTIDIQHWAVERGESVFIHGPSGTGKTTLLNLLGGLLTPSQGTIYIAGECINHMGESKRNRFRAHEMGFIFQQFNLIPYLSPIENIQLAGHFGSTRPRKDLLEHTHSLLETLAVKAESWHQPSQTLSVGEQQRVAIARALINKPKLLIADEPTSSLDDANKARFIELLSGLAQQDQLALIFVSHDTALASHFDRVEALAHFNQIGASSCS